MTKSTTTRKPTKAQRAAAEAATKAAQDAAAIAAIKMPTKEQLDAEAAAAQAEEAANLEREAAELAEEATKPKIDDGYTGPMLALRDRAKQGAYTKAANGQLCCGDAVATLMGTLPPEGVIKACMIALDLPANPYTHLNVGQQSMNLRNKLRGALKRGEFGLGVVREAVEEVQVALNVAHILSPEFAARQADLPKAE